MFSIAFLRTDFFCLSLICKCESEGSVSEFNSSSDVGARSSCRQPGGRGESVENRQWLKRFECPPRVIGPMSSLIINVFNFLTYLSFTSTAGRFLFDTLEVKDENEAVVCLFFMREVFYVWELILIFFCCEESWCSGSSRATWHFEIKTSFF